jgi:hypothetical protein
LGIKRYGELLPPEVGKYRVQLNSHLSLRKSLELASKSTPADKVVLVQLIAAYKTFSPGSKALAKLSPKIARAILLGRTKALNVLDKAFKRSLKRWKSRWIKT